MGTRRCPLRASTSSRRERRCPTTTTSTAIPSRRNARATRPHWHSQSVGVLQRYGVATPQTIKVKRGAIVTDVPTGMLRLFPRPADGLPADVLPAAAAS
jgi:hypothetical protein